MTRGSRTLARALPSVLAALALAVTAAPAAAAPPTPGKLPPSDRSDKADKDKADKDKGDKGGPRDNTADVETAEQLFTKLDYDKANELAEKVLKQRNLTHDQLVRASRVVAVTSAILGKEEAAKDAFLQLLVFDPDYTVDAALGPKVSTPFIEARGQFRALPTKPGLDVAANVRVDGGQLRVTTRDPTHITKKVIVGYRWTSSGDYTVSQINVGEGTVEVGAAPKGRTRLDFYAQALDERDDAVFEAGSPQVPKSSFAQPTPTTQTVVVQKSGGSVFASPVFWIVTGAVLAGGAAGLYFATRKDEPATTALLSPVIRCGNDLCK
jgi:hypothetical protein